MSAEDRNGEVSTDEKCIDCSTKERSFDELTRGLASASVSRRGALRLLAGALFGGVLASVPGVGRIAGNNGEAQALESPGGSTCANGGQSCTAQHCCEGLNCLIDQTNSTEKFCCSPLSTLVCGSSCCPTGALGNCSAGKCVCPTGEVVCPDANNPLAGKCVNLLEDPDNCGGCGTVCPGPTGPDAPCQIRACVNGGCTTVPNPAVIPGVTPCEDGDVCTLGDTCNASGQCVSGKVKVCDQCLTCANVGGVATCVPDKNQVGHTCNDNNACTENEKCTEAGTCVGTPVVCDDKNECTADTCDPATGCVFTPLTGTACETGNKCTADVCKNGKCEQGPQNVTCPQCQACDPTTGTCKAAFEGLACDDGDLCTVGDKCENGTCKPGPVKTCGQCLKCDKGECVTDPAQEDKACDDQNACTTGEKCQSGVCTGGTLKTCPTGQTCNPVSGKCECTVGVTCGSTCCAVGEVCCIDTTGNVTKCCPSGSICEATTNKKGEVTGFNCSKKK